MNEECEEVDSNGCSVHVVCKEFEEGGRTGSNRGRMEEDQIVLSDIWWEVESACMSLGKDTKRKNRVQYISHEASGMITQSFRYGAALLNKSGSYISNIHHRVPNRLVPLHHSPNPAFVVSHISLPSSSR